MSVATKVLLGLLLVALLGIGVERWQIGRYQAHLTAVRDTAQAAQTTLRASNAVAVVLRSQSESASRQRDSLLDRERVLASRLLHATVAIPAAPAFTPDTCLPWQRRADSLAKALSLSQAVTATADSAGLAGVHASSAAQAAADTAIHAGQQADTSLGHIAQRVPAAPFRSTLLSLAVDARWTADPVGRHLSAAVLVKGFYAGIEARVQGSELTEQLMVGYRKELRIW
jgi:hypothetical protein